MRVAAGWGTRAQYERFVALQYAARRPVEDSMIIALDTEENLKRLGVKSVAVESSVNGALSAIEQRRPDFAIVDFNLGTRSSEPVANELKAQGVRFVLATGYAEMADQIERLGALSLLRKPYGRSEIEEILHAATQPQQSDTDRPVPE